jgi:heterodisulfide reductase subunit C
MHADGMDLTFGEILRYAATDDERAIVCDSLWSCEPLLGESLRCPSGIDVTAVVRALRREALRRGHHPAASTPERVL